MANRRSSDVMECQNQNTNVNIVKNGCQARSGVASRGSTTLQSISKSTSTIQITQISLNIDHPTLHYSTVYGMSPGASPIIHFPISDQGSGYPFSCSCVFIVVPKSYSIYASMAKLLPRSEPTTLSLPMKGSDWILSGVLARYRIRCVLHN